MNFTRKLLSFIDITEKSGEWPTTTGPIVNFIQSGARTTLASCQDPTLPTRWAIDVSTAVGQAAVAVLLTAYSTGKQIVIVGTGTCTVQPGTETVQYFYIVN